MASIKPGQGLPKRPKDSARARTNGAMPNMAPTSSPAMQQRRPNTLSQAQQPQYQSRIPNLSKTNIASRPPSIPTPCTRAARAHPVQARTIPNTASASTAAGSSTRRQPQDENPLATRNILRRKKSSIARNTAGSRDLSHISSSGLGSASASLPLSQASYESSSSQQLYCGVNESPAEVRVPDAAVENPKSEGQVIHLYPELDRYRDIVPRPAVSSDGPGLELPYRLATQDLPPPTPAYSGTSSQLSAFSASPSTRFSESPGPGPYSRDTTPTSMLSQSPGVVAPVRFTPHNKPRQLSPVLARLPATSRRAASISNEVIAMCADPQGLPVVRESSTSSSSNATVRDGHKTSKETDQKKSIQKSPKPPPWKAPKQSKEERREKDENASLEPVQPSIVPAPSSRPSLSHSHDSSSGHMAKGTPPVRPSRDGVSNLQSRLYNHPPIIHSNLSSFSLTSQGHGAEGQTGTDSEPQGASSRPALYGQREKASHIPMARQPTPVSRAEAAMMTSSQADNARTTSNRSPKTSTFNSRFPFFGRRSKTDRDVPQAERKETRTRKGPAAGTGHEGYGRLGATRRRSGGPFGASYGYIGTGTSQESLRSNQSMDPFLQERMHPVVISGGEIVDNKNVSSSLTRIESNQSSIFSRPSLESRGESDISTTSSPRRPDAKGTPAVRRGPRSTVDHRRPSDSSDSDALVMKSTLAFRRSVQRLRTSPDQAPFRLPKPINTSGITSPSITSIDTSVFSDDSHLEVAEREVGRGRLVATPAKKLTKRGRSPRNWNPFSRTKQASKKRDPEPVTATVKVVQQKPVSVPFYAMLDSSEQEENETLTVNNVLRDAYVPDTPLDVPALPALEPRSLHATSSDSATGALSTRNLPAQERRLQDEPYEKPAPDERVSERGLQEASVRRSPEKPSRLPHVGRIPKVASIKAQFAPSRSFSRPFNRISYQKPLHPTADNSASNATGPIPPSSSALELAQETSTTTDAEAQSVVPRPGAVIKTDEEFLAFSPNQSYDGTSSSSGCSDMPPISSIMCCNSPDAGPLVEDEVWDEYNDLIGDAPLPTALSTASSVGTPFHLESYERSLSKKDTQLLESPTIVQSPAASFQTTKELEKRNTATNSRTSSADMTERIGAAFAVKFEDPPGVPPSASEPAPDHETSDPPHREPLSPSQRRDSRASRVSGKSGGSSSSYRSSGDETAVAQVNLRIGSMTVSKWLSFGHVLFSPIKDELASDIGSAKRQSILVIDGLGNDDWSFYAAETYPAATFFNMSPRAPLSSEHRNASSFPLSPSNHHQIQYISHLDKFPFGPESFTSVVYRFPTAAPESHYRNIITEARRVLKPGGYIELSILDVDLNNMGNRARRTVRRLVKERIHETSPETTLGSASDLILRLLGRKGFVDIKTCRVGVPVASIVPRAQGEGTKATNRDKKEPRDQRSLADMMNDSSEAADENITKMVAKVGRWWYSRCYESVAGSGTTDSANKSIWNDRALLAECEEWGTSLKLMVCHARVPERTRVASI